MKYYYNHLQWVGVLGITITTSINFIRFIHNAGEGFTHWVDDGKWSYIPDKHTAVNKDWTVIAGTMDGKQWLSDRNRSAKPRLYVRRFLIMLMSGIMQRR